VVALPHELKVEQRLVLAQSFARTISDRYGNAVDLAVHAPRTDPRNFHAHLLTTTRQVTPYGLGEKTTIEWSGARRHEHGLPRFEQEYRNVRESWEEHANHALREAGLEQRISRAREPGAAQHRQDRVWLPRIAYEIEQRGGHSYLGDLVRRRLQERQQELPALPEKTRAQTREEQAADAVRHWRVWREKMKQGPELEPQARSQSQERSQERARSRGHGRDDDYGL
jgi:hypothetical protein